MAKKLTTAFLLIVLGVVLYFVQKDIFYQAPNYEYEDGFASLDQESWFVGEWLTGHTNYENAVIEDGKLILEVKETDKGPYLLSQPIAVEYGDVITIERRVKVHYGNEYFTGGFILYETDDEQLRPNANAKWSDSFGNALVAVEYVHNFSENSTRPGRDIFRVLGPDWEDKNNYQVAEPIFDTWFDETLIYDTRNNKVTYKLNGQEYKINGHGIRQPYIRVMTHSFGFGVGHVMEIDHVKILIEKRQTRLD